MSNLEKAKEIVKANYKNADGGIFDSRNFVGDLMETIYEDEGLTIDICYYYSYFEVFGLSDTEFEELERYYNSLKESEEWGMTHQEMEIKIKELEKRIKALEEQEPFMNKPCVAHQVCHEDKVKVLDKIRAEITKEAECTMNGDRAGGLYKALQIINKYKEKEGINNEPTKICPNCGFPKSNKILDAVDDFFRGCEKMV